MKRHYSSKILVLIATFLLCAPNSYLWAQDVGVTDTSIKIGINCNLTGAASAWGVAFSHGVITVFNEANKAGGINGRKLDYILIDDRCSPEGAKSAVKKLTYSDNVFFICGGCCSLATFGSKEEIINAKIPNIVLAATMDKIFEPVNRYIFSPVLAASVDGLAIVELFMSKPGTKRIAMVAHDNEWAKSKYEKGLALMKEKFGLELIARESLDSGATDATPQVLRIKQANPDAVMTILYPAEGAIFCRDAYKYGLKVPFAGPNTLADLYDLRDRVGREEPVRNMFATSYLKDTLSKYEDLAKIHASNFPQDKFSSYVLQGVGSARVAVEGLKRTGRNLTREKFIDALDTIKDFDTGVLSSLITFTKDDHTGAKKSRMVTLVDGKEYYMDPKWIEGLKTW